MNPRRVHEIMRSRYPDIDAANRNWKNIAGANVPTEKLLQDMVSQTLDGVEDVIVQVHRRVGTVLPTREVVAYLCQHMGEGEIRLADRDFTRFLVVARNGVATAWRKGGDADGAELAWSET